MDSSVFGLFVICSAMFFGAFVAGLSCYKLNRRQLSWLNCFAAGLLLGTALGVIVPEGVRSIYEDVGNESGGAEVGGSDQHAHHEGESHAHEHSHDKGHPERLLGKSSLVIILLLWCFFPDIIKLDS